MSRQPDRRKLKNYLILKDVQLKFISINFVHMLLVVLITAAALLAPVYTLLMQTADPEDQYRAALFFIRISEQLPIVMGMVLILFAIHQFIMTHQFCGPIINFSNTFTKITSGDLTRRVYLRKYDFLHEEGRCINGMIDSLSGFVNSIRKEHEVLLLCLQDISVNPATADERQKSEQALRAALQHAQAVKDRMAYFKLTEDLSQNL